MEKVNAQQQQAMDAWKTVVDEHMARVSGFYNEMARLESRGIEQLNTGIDQFSKLWKESFSYASQVSSELRRLTLDTARRTADLLMPRS